MVIPGGLRKTTFRRRKQAKDRIARQAERQRQQILAPEDGIGRKPATILMIVAVLVIVGGLLLGRASYRFRTPAKIQSCAVADRELRALRIALERFCRDCGRYPSGEEGLKALVLNPGIDTWQGPYVSLIKPDPWRNRYHYTVEERKLLLRSCGPDGTAGTADDMFPKKTTQEEIDGD